MSIADLLEKRREHPDRIFGAVVGIVTNNQDEDGLGRVKVKIPRLSGEDESYWARVVSFMAGMERGAFFLPEVDDEVLVIFEHGDITMPYIIGSLWNGEDVPPETNSDGENNIRVIKSRSGHVIRLNDKDGEEIIEIIDKTEKNFITISAKDNKVSISSDKDIELTAKNGKISLDAKDVEIKSSANTNVEASANLDLNASGNNTIKGATVNIN